MWVVPLKCKTETGEAINTYFLDTEGLDDLEGGKDGDRKLAAMVVMLSSYLIYNSNSIIDKDAIDTLGLAV